MFDIGIFDYIKLNFEFNYINVQKPLFSVAFVEVVNLVLFVVSARAISSSSRFFISLFFSSKNVFLLRSAIKSGNGFDQSAGGCSRFVHISLS